MWVFTRKFLRAALTEMAGSNTIGYTGVLKGLKLGLIKAPFTPTPDLLLAGVTQADYTGYSAVTFTWGTAHNDPLQNPTIEAAPSIIFQPSDAVSPNTIYGHMLLNAGGTELEGAELFNAPFNLPDQFSQINDTPVVVLPPGAGYGNSIVF